MSGRTKTAKTAVAVLVAFLAMLGCDREEPATDQVTRPIDVDRTQPQLQQRDSVPPPSQNQATSAPEATQNDAPVPARSPGTQPATKPQ